MLLYFQTTPPIYDTRIQAIADSLFLCSGLDCFSICVRVSRSASAYLLNHPPLIAIPTMRRGYEHESDGIAKRYLDNGSTM